MHVEVHIHAAIHLRQDVRVAEINAALQPWLDYLDIHTIDEVKSLHQDELGIHFDSRGSMLDICWSGDVERSFGNRIEPVIRALCALSEDATEIEVSYYDEDGNQEMNILFVGPTPLSIHEAQRRRMAEDISELLARHFDEPAIGEVVSLVNNLFAQDWIKRSQGNLDEITTQNIMPLSNKRLLH